MSAAYGVFYQCSLPGHYVLSARPCGKGVKGTGRTCEEALENLQSLWRDMGMVPWEPGRNLIGGGRAEVVGERCLLPSVVAAETDMLISQIMENSR